MPNQASVLAVPVPSTKTQTLAQNSEIEEFWSAMALAAIHFRRAVSLSFSLLNCHRLRPLSSFVTPPPPLPNPRKLDHSLTRTRSFRSSTISLDRRSFDDGGKISPDEIPLEGCDYNHWLITIDFPKNPKPTAEEMVETYVQTAAKVFGSVEEAKKRIYACSTTTYHGFQALMDEETSEKFRGLPGVVFILPDSYIDTANKEYGGDKYENGVITPPRDDEAYDEDWEDEDWGGPRILGN